MPLPICPAPITPTDLILPAIFLFTSWPSNGRTFYAEPRWLATLGMTGRLTPDFAKLRREFGQGLIKVGNQPVIGDLEDRCFLILVDGDDHLGILHAGQMLDRAGNADRNVEVRRNYLAGLSDLPVVRRIAGIDRRARGADRSAELVRHRLDIFGEVVARLHGAAARDDDPGRGQLRPVRLRELLANE